MGTTSNSSEYPHSEARARIYKWLVEESAKYVAGCDVAETQFVKYEKKDVKTRAERRDAATLLVVWVLLLCTLAFLMGYLAGQNGLLLPNKGTAKGGTIVESTR